MSNELSVKMWKVEIDFYRKTVYEAKFIHNGQFLF